MWRKCKTGNLVSICSEIIKSPTLCLHNVLCCWLNFRTQKEYRFPCECQYIDWALFSSRCELLRDKSTFSLEQLLHTCIKACGTVTFMCPELAHCWATVLTTTLQSIKVEPISSLFIQKSKTSVRGKMIDFNNWWHHFSCLCMCALSHKKIIAGGPSLKIRFTTRTCERRGVTLSTSITLRCQATTDGRTLNYRLN